MPPPRRLDIGVDVGLKLVHGNHTSAVVDGLEAPPLMAPSAGAPVGGEVTPLLIGAVIGATLQALSTRHLPYLWASSSSSTGASCPGVRQLGRGRNCNARAQTPVFPLVPLLLVAFTFA